MASAPAASFWDHLHELRSRLLKCFLAVALGASLAYAIWERLWSLMAWPLTRQNLAVTFIATSPLETFLTSLKLSLLTGIILAFPFIMWQVWRFLAPALYRHEKKLFLGAFAASLVLFLAGAAFAYFVVIPMGLHFLATYNPGSVVQSWKQADYAAFISQFLLAFGTIFELPVVTFVLARLALITASGMWSFFRYAIILIFVTAAILTPGPDPVSQILLAIPLCFLYLASILVARYAYPGEVKA